jgi:hypothetical protein
MLDGTSIVSKNPMDEIGQGVDPMTVALMEDSDILEMLGKANNGADLIDILDEYYDGMFKMEPPYDNTDYICYELYKEAAYEELMSITNFDAVDCIILSDEWISDYGKTYKAFQYDPKNKTGKTVVHKESDEYEDFDEDNEECDEDFDEYDE